ncbi:MAG: tetratricopeptide repeat protein [Planctomycetota bacterium]|nr:tetratricopeptide repeat protein [Planctomycetota bacterium]
MIDPHSNAGVLMSLTVKLSRVASSVAITVSLVFFTTSSFGCMWDTNTIRDEMDLEDTPLFHLITGQFPEHSQAFYSAQAARSLALLDEKANDLAARDDLGVAYTKLGQFNKALAVFKALDALKPNRYETLSNFGVLYKKMGRFTKAHEYIKRALALKPGGHMGLGDWYLRMIGFRMQSGQKDGPISENFLGYDYGQQEWVWELGDEQEHVFLSKLKAMIRNDRHFPDTYIVLGDLLNHRSRKKNLALWCYARSLELEHPRPQIIHARIREIHQHWKDAIKNTYTVGKYVEGLDGMLQNLRLDLRGRETWLGQFKDVEEEFIELKQSHSFPTVAEHLLRKRKIVIAPPVAYGIKRKLSLTEDTTKLRRLALLVIVLLSLLFAYKAQRSWRQEAL